MSKPESLREVFAELEAFVENRPEYLRDLIEGARAHQTDAVAKLLRIAIPEPGYPGAIEEATAEAERRAARYEGGPAPQAMMGVLWPE